MRGRSRSGTLHLRHRTWNLRSHGSPSGEHLPGHQLGEFVLVVLQVIDGWRPYGGLFQLVGQEIGGIDRQSHRESIGLAGDGSARLVLRPSVLTLEKSVRKLIFLGFCPVSEGQTNIESGSLTDLAGESECSPVLVNHH